MNVARTSCENTAHDQIERTFFAFTRDKVEAAHTHSAETTAITAAAAETRHIGDRRNFRLDQRRN